MRSRYYQALWTFGLDPSELITKVEHSEKVRLSLEFAASPVDGKNWQKHIDTWLDFQIMAKATEDEVNAKDPRGFGATLIEWIVPDSEAALTITFPVTMYVDFP